MAEKPVENGQTELPQRVHPGVFVKSAQTTEKMADELPRAAKECGKSARKSRVARAGGWNWYSTPRAIQMIIKRKELREEQFG